MSKKTNKKYILLNKKSYYAGGFEIKDKKIVPLTVNISVWGKKYKLLSQAKKAKEAIKLITGKNFYVYQIISENEREKTNGK